MTRSSMYVHRKDGVTKWFDGCEITVKLWAASTNGTLGFAEGLIPPGAVPEPDAHVGVDETFYLLPGQLAMLDGGAHFLAGPGDIVRVRRGIRHEQERWAERR